MVGERRLREPVVETRVSLPGGVALEQSLRCELCFPLRLFSREAMVRSQEVDGRRV